MHLKANMKIKVLCPHCQIYCDAKPLDDSPDHYTFLCGCGFRAVVQNIRGVRRKHLIRGYYRHDSQKLKSVFSTDNKSIKIIKEELTVSAKKNMNELARKIAMNEGGKRELPIGQIKEVLKLVALIVAQDEEYRKLFEAYGRKLAKKDERGGL